MENIRKSALVKLLCYILIPIMLFILVISIADIVITSEYGNNIGKAEYIKSENFGENYLYGIISDIRYIRNNQQDIYSNYTQYAKISDESYSKPIYYRDFSYNDGSISSYIKYIIIDEQSGDLYTNIKSTDYQKEINEIEDNEIYWIYENEKISTNLETINQDNAKYILASYANNYLSGVKVYTTFDVNSFSYSNSFYVQEAIHNIFKNNENMPAYLIPLSSIILIIMIVYLFWAIGHEKDREGIVLNGIDRIPYEILFCIITFIVGMLMSVSIASVETRIPQKILLSLIFLSYLGCYASSAVLVVTTIKRIKAKEFWHSFLIYKIYKWFKVKLKRIYREITDRNSETGKTIILYWGFIIISVILSFFVNTGIGIIILVAFWIWTFNKILQHNKKIEKINQALKDIYDGHPNIKLNEEELTGVLKIMAKYINDIAGGFSNAIEQSLKSERLKTELITNVSHDIKTPLTSIINYVDLLKEEDIQNEQVKQYINILDQKSQRLKKLIEDLVEASKVSSGNVKLNIEEINLKELLKQTTGEFEDKFKQKKLIIDIDLPDEDIIIKADNRYIYRIIENLFSNITKYAMENSRVYIDLRKLGNKIKLEIKNVSKDKLNISSEELMQRFVRGDKSRYTEGSGLGLSIAESLTEIQGGKFSIDIDGDLFKVIIIWNN